MKLNTPEISWHGKEPVLSVDFCKIGSTLKFATAGADNDVKIWTICYDKKSGSKVEFIANLSRHNKAVNVVRFSPNEEILASGGDDCCVILWKLSVNQEQSVPALKDSDDDIENRESWTASKVLRGHIEDVYDIAWSPDGSQLISGSVDNSAIIWDVTKGTKLAILKDHKHYIQGVCWDPLGQYVVTNSSDRSCRLYSPQSYRCCYNINKLSGSSNMKLAEGVELKQLKMFHDESLLSFFRRPSFTPDGSLLIVPAGRIEMSNQVLNTTYVFTRGSQNKPVLYLPSPKKPTVAVRCCPVLFDLRTKDKEIDKENEEDSPPLFQLPYRMVFAVASLNAIYLYDTQHTVPFGYISNIHYSGITDVTWSNDGSVLVVCSSDGYCSWVNFEDGEIGAPYKMTAKEVLDTPTNQSANSIPNMETPDNSGKTTKRVVLTPVQKMEVVENPTTPDNEITVKKRDTPSIQKFAVPVSQLTQNNTPPKSINKITPRRVQLITPEPKNDTSTKTAQQSDSNLANTATNMVSQVSTASTNQSTKPSQPEGQPSHSKPRRVQLISQTMTGQPLANKSPQVQSVLGPSEAQTSNPKPRRVELISQPIAGQETGSQTQTVVSQPVVKQQEQDGSHIKPRRVQLISQPMNNNETVVNGNEKAQSAVSTAQQSVNNPKPRRVELISQPTSSSQTVPKVSTQAQSTVSTAQQSVNNPKPRRVELISQPTSISQTVPKGSPQAQSTTLTAQQNTNITTPRRVELISQPKTGQQLQASVDSPKTAEMVSKPATQPSVVQNTNNSKPRRVQLISQPPERQVASVSPQTQPSAQSINEHNASNQKPRNLEEVAQTTSKKNCSPAPQVKEDKSQLNQGAKAESIGESHRPRNPIPLEPVVIVLE